MKIKQLFLLICLTGLIVEVGCASYCIDRIDREAPLPMLSKSGSAYVSVCMDARSQKILYSGSGDVAMQFIKDEFSKYFTNVGCGETPETFEKARNTALYYGYQYLVYPSITLWESQESSEPCYRDQVKLKIILAETLSGNQLDSIEISGKSRLSLLGRENPEDLLAAPIRIYVASLFD